MNKRKGKGKKHKNIGLLAIKYAHSRNRLTEITAHGKPLQQSHIEKSKKIYNRNKINKTTEE
ncbi:MAG: hypothetical protein FWD66_04310 [Paludibacter sp.]|nr:hypothetical protein [Paludibacter sp.]